MTTLLIAAATTLSGKTTIAVAIARALGNAALKRIGDDANAEPDRKLFASLALQGNTPVIELPAGDPASAIADNAGARVIVVATPQSAEASSEMAKGAGSSLAGVILNRASARGEANQYTGATPIAVVLGDRVLGAPTLADVATALNAETENLEGNSSRLLDKPIIASIAADPGQAYFDRTRADSVIVRSDKPDLQLAALNSGAECLIITGGLPLLSYVRDRVAADEIPLLRTALDTKGTVSAIEALYGAKPFGGEAARLNRLDELFASADLSRLTG